MMMGALWTMRVWLRIDAYSWSMAVGKPSLQSEQTMIVDHKPNAFPIS
jgi:hypothetical protein